jgi:hypothetical protein
MIITIGDDNAMEVCRLATKLKITPDRVVNGFIEMHVQNKGRSPGGKDAKLAQAVIEAVREYESDEEGTLSSGEVKLNQSRKIGRPQTVTDAQVLEAKNLRASGVSLKTAASMLGVNYNTLRQAISSRSHL